MTQATRVTQTVILAAGSGTRLTPARGEVPKPLMTVAGTPLVAHALRHAHASGCEEAVIVIGFEGDRVRAAIEAMHLPLRLTFVTNPDYTSPNGVSLLAAEPAAAPAFYLQMVDHLFAAPALHQLVRVPLDPHEGGRLLVDHAPAEIDLEDATKVRLAGDRITAIGKGLEPWDAIDAGCFVLTHAIFDALRRAPAEESRTVSSGMRQLVADGRLGAVNIHGIDWVDVDTPADREIAERLLGRPQYAIGRQ